MGKPITQPGAQATPKANVREVPPDYQPSKAELEADVSIPDATPDDLLRAVIHGGRQPS